jgi:hypothetical protein
MLVTININSRIFGEVEFVRMAKGLDHCNVDAHQRAGRSHATNVKDFKKHYGAPPSEVAEMWEDLCTTDLEDVRLKESEMGQKGLKCILMVHCFLWNYPKNAVSLGKRFGVGEKLASGQHLWHWVGKVAALRALKIVWPPELNDPNGEEFIITSDNTDVKISEKKHPHCNLDRSFFSQKHNHGGLKCEVAAANFQDQIVWVNGPFKATRHDLTIFRYNGLKAKMPPDKWVIADLALRSSREDEMKMISCPNSGDSIPFKKFKSLCRCRLESVFSRLKNCNVLKNEFTHSVDKNELCFVAVCVITQHHLDNGGHLFKVY